MAEMAVILIKAAGVLGALLFMAAYMTWMERRVFGLVQVRYGPNRVGPAGLLQPIADGVKLLFKESVIPDQADKLVYLLAPAITLTQAVMSNILSGHGRAFEFEADEKGLYYAWKAGYEPREAAKFMRRLRQLERLRGIGYHGFGSTHPETTMRILKLEELAQVLARPGQKLAVKGDPYKAQLSGLVYGERKEGFRLRAYRARGGETLSDLAADFLGNRNFSLELALLNDLDDQAVLKKGQRIKIVLKK